MDIAFFAPLSKFHFFQGADESPLVAKITDDEPIVGCQLSPPDDLGNLDSQFAWVLFGACVSYFTHDTFVAVHAQRPRPGKYDG
jgi:hypothetical protein